MLTNFLFSLQSHCDCTAEKNSDYQREESKVLTPLQISEMSKQIDLVKKFVFQIEKILLETNPSSNSCFGQASFNLQKAARSDEIWQIISLLNGILGECLVSLHHAIVFKPTLILNFSCCTSLVTETTEL